MGSKDSETELKRFRRVVVTTTKKNRLIQACHDGIDGGHYGRDKTSFINLHHTQCYFFLHAQLSESYWWKGMVSDMSEYCKTCDTCQRVNNRLGRAKAELHPIPVTDVWKQIGIDLIGTLYMYIYMYMCVSL